MKHRIRVITGVGAIKHQIMAAQSRYSFATLDVFTTARFSGNPLAIVRVPVQSPLSQEQKHQIAREFNLSETVFLHEAEHDSSGHRIDIFTTTLELPFAGHPTIGSICYILGDKPSRTGEKLSATLITKAGSIAVTYDPSNKIAEADIPHDVHIHSGNVLKEVIKGLQHDGMPSDVEHDMDASFPVVSIVNGMTFALVKVPSVDALRLLTTGGKALQAQVDDGWGSGFVAPYFYAKLGNDTEGTVRLRTRMIEPGCGEDPATGSAACTLASFLALQAGGVRETFSFSIEQGVEMGRRSLIRVKVTLDETGKAVRKVLLSGSAVPVMQGTLSA